MKHVAFSNVYYPDAADWAQIEQAYKAPLAEGSTPSLGAFHLSALPGGIKVEITFIASQDDYITRLYPAGAQADGLASPASLTGGTLYLSSVTKPGATLEEQMRAIMAEHEARLKLADMTFAHVTNANVYLADMGDFDAMNAVFREYFGANPPARTTVGMHFTQGEKLAIALTAVE
jgi:2-iminobutanoate/2-iminopropanoate deaminase